MLDRLVEAGRFEVVSIPPSRYKLFRTKDIQRLKRKLLCQISLKDVMNTYNITRLLITRLLEAGEFKTAPEELRTLKDLMFVRSSVKKFFRSLDARLIKAELPGTEAFSIHECSVYLKHTGYPSHFDIIMLIFNGTITAYHPQATTLKITDIRVSIAEIISLKKQSLEDMRRKRK